MADICLRFVRLRAAVAGTVLYAMRMRRGGTGRHIPLPSSACLQTHVHGPESTLSEYCGRSRRSAMTVSRCVAQVLTARTWPLSSETGPARDAPAAPCGLWLSRVKSRHSCWPPHSAVAPTARGPTLAYVVMVDPRLDQESLAADAQAPLAGSS
jgi:hypothetical protein